MCDGGSDTKDGIEVETESKKYKLYEWFTTVNYISELIQLTQYLIHDSLITSYDM